MPGARSAPIPHRPLSSASSGGRQPPTVGGGLDRWATPSMRTVCAVRRAVASCVTSVRVEALPGLATEMAGRDLVDAASAPAHRSGRRTRRGWSPGSPRDVSSPTRSSSANGPIGKLQPPFIAVSIDSIDAVPRSSMRTALLRYGNSRALTMNPAWSCTSTAPCRTTATNAMAAAIVSSLAVIGRTTSTSFITVAGLKKWMPQTCSGRASTIASSITGSVDVLVARIADRLDDSSSSANSAILTSRSSITDSITRSHSASAAESVGGGDPPTIRVCGRRRWPCPARSPSTSPLVDHRDHRLGRCLRPRAHDDLVPGAGGDLGQPGAHDPGADDADRAYRRAAIAGL